MMDLEFLGTTAFWTAAGGVSAAVVAFFTGKATARKTNAEADKIRRETDLMSAKEVQTAEERLHDRAMNAMAKLAEMYERNLASMQTTLSQMEAEVEELRKENAKLTVTVDTLTQDNARLRDLVSELQTHVQTLIVALRQTKHELPHLVEVMSGYDDPGTGFREAASPGVNHSGGTSKT